jgi:REP element-mobilizing transposase RayT
MLTGLTGKVKSKFQNKYRNKTARAPWWDYGEDAAYFVIINTRDRRRSFGDVMDEKMQLSEIGNIANQCWIDIPKHFPFVRLGDYVVMPDHVHGILIIDKTGYNAGPKNKTAVMDIPEPELKLSGLVLVGTQNFVSLPKPAPDWQHQPSKNKFGPQSQNLPSIVRGYKIGVAKGARKIIPGFAWQPRYHDHLIRDEREYQRIAAYIQNNPKNWTGKI